MSLLYNEWLDSELLKVHYNNLKNSTYHETTVRLIKKYFRKKDKINVMDFGAGYGNFCSLTTQLGFNTYAFDLSSDKNDHMNSMGVTIISSFEKYQSYFDFIWVNQVFEHLAHPDEILKELAQCLNDKGIIFIAVPDCKNVKDVLSKDGLSNRLFKFISPHQHINAFENKTLKLLGTNAGLKPLTAVDFLKFYNTSLNLNELKFLTKKTIKNSAFSTGLFFKKA
jgi:2-polyprenyl-3-methyl-5-hydroxy-6-metoxy-1,4-benzoquinol methylase